MVFAYLEAPSAGNQLHPWHAMKYRHHRGPGAHPAKFGATSNVFNAGGPRHLIRRPVSPDAFNNAIPHIVKIGDKVQLSMDLPGVKASDLKIQVENHTLAVSANRNVHTNKGGVRKVHYVRKFRLNNIIDADKLTANLSNGVLVLTAPTRQASGPVQIPITTNATEVQQTFTETTLTVTENINVTKHEIEDKEEDNDIVVVDLPDEEIEEKEVEMKPVES
jgi:HSP20 family molecular chaperone IbpA